MKQMLVICNLLQFFHLFPLLDIAAAYRRTHQLHFRILCQLLLLLHFFDNITKFAQHLKVV